MRHVSNYGAVEGRGRCILKVATISRDVNGGARDELLVNYEAASLLHETHLRLTSAHH